MTVLNTVATGALTLKPGQEIIVHGSGGNALFRWAEGFPQSSTVDLLGYPAVIVSVPADVSGPFRGTQSNGEIEAQYAVEVYAKDSKSADMVTVTYTLLLKS